MTTPTLPTISILLPVYNAGQYLRVCLNSILAQTYSNWELIAINDASTDDSLDILRHYADIDPRIRIYSNPKNRGIATSLNRAISLARGQYLARIDADDIMYPHRLTRQLHYLRTHPNTVIVGGQCTTIDNQGHLTGLKSFPTQHDNIYQLAFLRSPVQHPAIMINRTLVPTRFTWYHTSCVPAEDLDLYFRLFEYGRFANLSSRVIKYRQHSNSLSLKNPRRTFTFAQKIRFHALRHGYRPSLITILLHVCQIILITLLPSSLIFPLYAFLRGTSHSPLRLPSPNLFPLRLTSPA